MNGAIPPLPNTPSWRGAQLKHRDNFTFHFYLLTLNKVGNNKLQFLEPRLRRPSLDDQLHMLTFIKITFLHKENNNMATARNLSVC
jgi:hypothetical protein